MSKKRTAVSGEDQTASGILTEEAPNGFTYEQSNSEGLLTLRGDMDIFEAQALHAAAVRALGDAEAGPLKVDLTKVRRVDLSILQILTALRRDIEAAGRVFAFDIPESMAQAIAQSGLAL